MTYDKFEPLLPKDINPDLPMHRPAEPTNNDAVSENLHREEVVLERLQICRATTNNGRKRHQRKMHMRVSLYALTRDQSVELAVGRQIPLKSGAGHPGTTSGMLQLGGMCAR